MRKVIVALVAALFTMNVYAADEAKHVDDAMKHGEHAEKMEKKTKVKKHHHKKEKKEGEASAHDAAKE
jgi:hypothetical protein